MPVCVLSFIGFMKEERVDDLQPFDDEELLDGYVAEAAWFWFDPSTHEKSLEVGLHQVIALCLRDELHARGLMEPDDVAVFARAKAIFPADDLRALPK